VVARWLEQARDPRISGEIASIYHDAAEAIDRERPLCLASGHCCHFDAFGHDLFVTALETAWFVSTMEPALPESTGAHATHAAPQTRANDTRGVTQSALALPVMDPRHGDAAALATADSKPRRSCPWLDGRLCGARLARPLGCRTYYCDPRAALWSEPLHESLHGRIRALHERFDIVYHYGEWLRMLSLFGADRRTEKQP